VFGALGDGLVKRDDTSEKTEKCEKSEKSESSGSKRRGPRVDSTVQGQIGAHLREMYSHVLNEPVPERFLELLKQLERDDGKKA
jgi:hypothetical protein